MTAHFSGKVAVVTGAGSGMGQALAVELGKLGAKLAISDVNEDGLAATERQLKAIGTEAKVDRVDVADREAVKDYADEVVAHYGSVNQLFNIAGISFNGDLEVSRFEDLERVMQVDFWGVVNGTKTFLPHLIASGDGHVINMSSVAGLFASRGQTAYCAAKFAVRGFTEALRQEMIGAAHPVKVTAVHPGGVRTGIIRNGAVADGLSLADFERLFDDRVARLSPERAAKIIIHGVQRNRARILVGADARFVDLLVRATGSGYQRIMMAVADRALPPSR